MAEALEDGLWTLRRERSSRALRVTAAAYSRRFQDTKDMGDLHAAIALLTEGADGWLDHAGLGHLLYERFWSGLPYGDTLADLDLIAAQYELALARWDGDDEQERDGLRVMLGLALVRRAARRPDLAEADERRADELLGPLHLKGRLTLEGEYGLGYVRAAIGRRTGRRDALDTGIELMEHCLHEIGDPDIRHEALMALTSAYRFRKDPRDLGRVTVYLRELWGATGDDDPVSRAEAASALGGVLFDVACAPEATKEQAQEAIGTLAVAVGLLGGQEAAAHVAQTGLLRVRHGEPERGMGDLMRALGTGALGDDLAGQCHTQLGLMLLREDATRTETLDAAIMHLEQGSAPIVLEHAGRVRAAAAGGFDPVAVRAVIDGLRRDRSALPQGDPAGPALEDILGQLLTRVIQIDARGSTGR